jgi:hypothetical protein
MPVRGLRVRVALYLRAVLRMEGAVTVNDGRCRRRNRGECCTCWPGYARPLWLDAKPHKETP